MQDKTEGAKLMRLAADLGHITSIYNAAKSYRVGRNGVSQDLRKAVQLYRAIILRPIEDGEVHDKQASTTYSNFILNQI